MRGPEKHFPGWWIMYGVNETWDENIFAKDEKLFNGTDGLYLWKWTAKRALRKAQRKGIIAQVDRPERQYTMVEVKHG